MAEKWTLDRMYWLLSLSFVYLDRFRLDKKNYEMTFREGKTRRVTVSWRRPVVTEVKGQAVSHVSEENSLCPREV